MAYESITCFAGLLKQDPGTMTEMTRDDNGVFHMPYYLRSDTMSAFEHAFYESGLMDRDYIENLERSGINPAVTNAATLDVSSMGAPLLLTILTKCVRSERFCEGALLGAAESGLLDRCLDRLAELDEQEELYTGIPTETRNVAAAILRILEESDEAEEVTTSGLAIWLTRDEPHLLDEEKRERLEQLLNSGETDMMDLDFAMRHDAAAYGLVLDSTAYENMILGLPHYIPYTVRRIEDDQR